MKKILFIMHLPPPWHGASVVGKSIYDSEVINQSFACHYINLSASDNVSEVGSFSFRKLFFLITNLYDILKTFLKFKPELCYLTPTSDGLGFYRDFIVVKILKLFKAKIVLHFHNKAAIDWGEKWYNQLLLKSFFKGVKIILLGEELYPEKSPYIDISEVFYCPNGVEKRNKLDYIIPKENTKTRFLFLSNIMSEKGVFVLLNACKYLSYYGYDYHCDFVGGWKDIEKNDIEKEIENLGLLGSVTFHGPIYGDDKDIFFKGADVFLFPTFYHGETFGLVLLEAMDWALPCISTFEGCIPSIIVNKETGFCIQGKDHKILAKKMIWMIENPDERIRMGNNGRQRFLKHYTVDNFEKRLKFILNECLN